jgi:hypothetical protein
MAGSTTMAERNVTSAEAYYRAMSRNDVESMSKYLHTDVRVVTPMGEVAGKEPVLEAAQRLMPHIMDIEIRARFSEG